MVKQTKLLEVEMAGTRYAELPRMVKLIFLIATVCGLGIAVFYNFGFTFFGEPLIDYNYYWLYMVAFASCIFLVLPARAKDEKKVPWYDYIAFIVTAGACFYSALHGLRTSMEGWYNIPAGVIVLLAILEGARRGAGPIFAAVTLVLAGYPLFASYMPGMFWGPSFVLGDTIRILIYSSEGLLGIPTKIAGEYVIGFMVFAGVLMGSGGGEFFLQFANALVGRYRGGPAKISCFSSAFFGSMSGSAVANVAADGCFTIPTMKRVGFPPHYASAIEAVASTGGMIMPPVMGAVAFVMAEFLGVEYRDIVIAAAIPAILYYFGLLMQIDAYAAKAGLLGLPKEEVPSLKQTLKDGWPFIFVVIFLTWGLVYMQWERRAPWYASGLLLLLSFYRRQTWMTPGQFLNTLINVGILIAKTTAVILPIGFIIAGLTVTGVSGSFTSGLVKLGMGNVVLILLFGVIACYIMGMAGLVTAAYIFLAVTLAPALMKIAPLNKMAVHMFILYYSCLACFTPPVATAVFVAAAIGGAPVMKTGLAAMRFGIVIYFVPFYFIFNPALIMQGSLIEAIYLFCYAIIGIVLVAAGCEGYLLKIGKVSLWARPLLMISGLLIVFPEHKTTIIGAVVAALTVAIMLIMRRREEVKFVREQPSGQ